MCLDVVCLLLCKSVRLIKLILLLFVILSHIFVELRKFSVVFFLFLAHVDHFLVEFGIDDSQNLVDVHVGRFCFTRTAITLMG